MTIVHVDEESCDGEEVQAEARTEEEAVQVEGQLGDKTQANVPVEDVQAETLIVEEVQAETFIEEEQAETPIEKQETTSAIVDAATETHNSPEPVRGSKPIVAWLSTLDSSEELPQPLVPRNNATWDDNDSGDEETTRYSAEGTNPFISAMYEDRETEVISDFDQDCNAQLQMESFMQRIQLREAVPHFALVSRDTYIISLKSIFAQLSFASPMIFSGSTNQKMPSRCTMICPWRS